MSAHKKILVIAMWNSIHTRRWLSLFEGIGCEIVLFNSYSVPFAKYALSYGANVKCYNTETRLRKCVIATLRHPIRVLLGVIGKNGKNSQSLFASLVRELEVGRLRRLLLTNDFALIHTLHTQTSAALLLSALAGLHKKIPRWAHTVWGSDLYLHHHLPDARLQLQELLPRFDFYWGEGRRDYALARALGFTGSFLPPIPAFGGFDVSLLSKIQYVPPSQRKVILVKGYQNAVGRANVAFAALELCHDLLRGYEIVIFSYENEIVPMIGRIFGCKFGIPVRCVSGVGYEKILEMHASARTSISLSTSDGLPASFVEALACGEFPIQSNTSMAYEWCSDGETALLVPPEDPGAVAVALRKALTDDALVDRAAEINRKMVMDQLDNRRVSASVKDVYLKMIAGENPADPTPDAASMVTTNNSTDCSDVKVSVVTIAYNQERFIEQTLEGFVSQETNFATEFIVGDDASTDGTADIIRKYAAKYPDRIKPVFRGQNVGALPNLVDLFSRTRGEFVAVCDGDDYWTDPRKLQKQVEFLEANPDLSACCHPVIAHYEDGSTPDEVLRPLEMAGAAAVKSGRLLFSDIVRMNTVASLSVMYRWQIPRQLPKWMNNYKVGDLPVLLFHADKGPIGVVKDVMGTYRKHAASSWYRHNETQEQLLRYIMLLTDINNELEGRHEEVIGPIVNYVRTVELPKASASSELFTESDGAHGDVARGGNVQPESTGRAEVEPRVCSIKVRFKQFAKKVVRRVLPDCLWNRLYLLYHIDECFMQRDARIEALALADRKVDELNSHITIQDESLMRIAKEVKDLSAQGQVCDEVLAYNRQKIDDMTATVSKLGLLTDAVRSLCGQWRQDGISFESSFKSFAAEANLIEMPENYDVEWTRPDDAESWLAHVRTDTSCTVDALWAMLSVDARKGLSRVHELLSDADSRELLVRLVAWRLMGFSKVKVLSNERDLSKREFMKMANALKAAGQKPLQTVDFTLECFDLSAIGFPLRCYAVPLSIAMDFVLLQYENDFVSILPGDVVLDCGGCWGDTALLFAEKAGEHGLVLSFEFVKANLDVFQRNLRLNPELSKRIEIINAAVADVSGREVRVRESGTSSSIMKAPTSEGTCVHTVTIDDVVRDRKLSHVDFLKMDIEGAETMALIGSKETIVRFRPRLAIAVYHRTDDLWQIPLLIDSFVHGYRFYLKHNTRSSLETVLLAVHDGK